MNTLHGVKLNTTVKLNEKDADPSKIEGLDVINGKYIIHVDDIHSRVKDAVVALSNDDILELATKLTYIRIQDDIRNSYKVVTTSETAEAKEMKRKVDAAPAGLGYSAQEITLMDNARKLEVIMSGTKKKKAS